MNKTPRKLTIYHFSDSHWIPKRNVSPGVEGPTREEQDLYSQLIRAFENTPLDKHKGDRNLLIHTGDFGNFYKFAKVPIEDMFLDVKQRHLGTLLNILPLGGTAIAVPGNHDYNLNTKDWDLRFKAFKEMTDGWTTSFTDPFFNIKFEGDSKPTVGLWLLNSAKHCGITNREHPINDQNTFSDVMIDDQDFKAYDSNPEKNIPFNIVVMHHNPLPQYGNIDSQEKNDIFVNNGNFNLDIINRNFKLVLSGHQHIGNEAFFSVPHTLNDSGRKRSQPYLERGYLSISAPSFLRHENSTPVGFNVIECEFIPDNHIATITLFQYRWLRGQTQQKFTETFITYPVILGSLMDFNEEERTRRNDILLQTFNHVYNKRSRIEHIEHALQPDRKPSEFLSAARVVIQDALTETQKIFAMYAISVLSPESWCAYDITTRLRPLFILNVQYAIERATLEGRHDSTEYYFSPSIIEAINCSIKIAEKLDAKNLISKRSADLGHNVEMYLSHAFDNNSPSFSVFGRNHTTAIAVSEEGNPKQLLAKHRKLVFHSNDTDLPYTWPSDLFGKQPIGFEAARIVIWPPEYFESSYALEVIRFHEDFQIPLFWLDPARLVSKNKLTKQTTQRKRIGMFMLSVIDSSQQSESQSFQRSRILYNNISGMTPITEDLHTAPSTDLSGFIIMDDALWGRNSAPEMFRNNRSHAAAEFYALLRRPDIMFAIDAFLLIKADKYNNIKQLLRKC